MSKEMFGLCVGCISMFIAVIIIGLHIQAHPLVTYSSWLQRMIQADVAQAGQTSGCGPVPPTPPSPPGCGIQIPVCFCDARGICFWTWQCSGT